MLTKTNNFVIDINTLLLKYQIYSKLLTQLNLGKKRIRIELEDEEGSKYNLSIDGNFSKDKVMKVFDLIDSLNIKAENTVDNYRTDYINLDLGSRIWKIIESFINKDFTSTDIFNIYCKNYENIQFSIISTYLARFFSKGKIDRTKHGKEWLYSLNKTSVNLISQEKFHSRADVTVYDLLR